MDGRIISIISGGIVGFRIFIFIFIFVFILLLPSYSFSCLILFSSYFPLSLSYWSSLLHPGESYILVATTEGPSSS